MSNSLFVKISIIITILSIIYTYLTYIGYIRYISLKKINNDISKYAKYYHSLESTTKEYRVIISMYVNNDNIDKINSVLKSILDQTTKVDEISINISKDVKDIPEYLKKYSNTYKLVNDYGDYNIIIPTLFREKDKDTIIILLPTNYIYGQNFISDFVESYLSYKKSNTNILLIGNNKHDNILNSPIITQISTFKFNIEDCDNILNCIDKDNNSTIIKYINNSIIKTYNYKENFNF